MGSDSHRVLEAWCSRKGILHVHSAEAWCSQTGTLPGQMTNTASDGLAPSMFHPFSGAVSAASCVFSPKERRAHEVRSTAGSYSHRAPKDWCFRKGTLQAQSAEAWCFRTGTLQA